MDSDMIKHVAQTDGFRWTHLILTAIVLPLMWLFWQTQAEIQNKVQDNAEAIALMSSNRFTSQDGLEVWREIGRIREDIAALPPQDFRDKLDEVERSINETNQRLARLETILENR